MPRSRYGQILCCALRRLVFGLQYNCLYAHALHQRPHSATANLMAFPTQQARQHPRPGKGKLHVQFVDPSHQ
ncbi:hypothetical protein AQ810_14865 [Burkholderia pseudomallei]|nr:hypothetical protein AQ810_14865 [Burkholderia pseudomallei]